MYNVHSGRSLMTMPNCSTIFYYSVYSTGEMLEKTGDLSQALLAGKESGIKGIAIRFAFVSVCNQRDLLNISPVSKKLQSRYPALLWQNLEQRLQSIFTKEKI